MGDVLSLVRLAGDLDSVRQPDRAADSVADERETDPFIDAQGKEALNFQITVAIAAAICLLLMVLIIGFFLLGLLAIGALVLTIIAGVKANEGFPYRYPFTWRLIK